MTSKYKHNIYRKSATIVNYHINFNSDRKQFELTDSGLEISHIYLTKGQVHRFHQANIANLGFPLVLTGLNPEIKILYVFKNQIISAEKYRQLMNIHVPKSCFVDVYLDSRYKDLKQGLIRHTLDVKNKNLHIQMQTTIEIGEDLSKLNEYWDKKQISWKQKHEQAPELSPMEHYRITQIKALEKRNTSGTIFPISKIKQDKQNDNLYQDSQSINDYDYLLINN